MPTNWTAIVDHLLGFAQNSDVVNPVSARRAASTVPSCGICEAIYQLCLTKYFQVSVSEIDELSGSVSPCKETVFALGRAALLEAPIKYDDHLALILKHTCIALHDFDLEAAHDGFLALCAFENRAPHRLPPIAKRFANQAESTLALFLDIFPDARLKTIFQCAVQMRKLNNAEIRQ